jgi:hypothetical protein
MLHGTPGRSDGRLRVFSGTAKLAVDAGCAANIKQPGPQLFIMVLAHCRDPAHALESSSVLGLAADYY